MISNVIAKVCHDLISPVNGLGLFVECIEGDLSKDASDQLNKYLNNFKAVAEMFRMFGQNDESDINIDQLTKIIKNHANLKGIECQFHIDDLSDVVKVWFAKSIAYMYLFAHKSIIKSGSINFFVNQNSCDLTVSSVYNLTDMDISAISNNSRDVMLYAGIQEIKKYFAKQIDFQKIDNNNAKIEMV